jgi:APA family basic amino acid/polyamine antiporter
MKITNIFQLERKALQRVLGAKDLFAIGFGDLGSSIYFALGITALFSLGATPISLAIAGCIFLFTALTYAELSSTFPESGGTASFTRYAFDDSVSFLAGWGLLFDYIITIAISAFAIAPYLQVFIPYFRNTCENHQMWHMAFTVGIIFLLYLLNVRGIKHSTKLSFILTTFTLITQLVIVGISLYCLFNLPTFIHHLKIGGADKLWSPTWSQFIEGTAMAMVAYTGIESIAQLGAETKNPGKTIPKAIFGVIVILLLSYFSISMSALSVMSPQELGTTFIDDPIAGIVSHLPFGGSILAPWVGLVAAIILLVASNAGLIGSSRLSFFMSEHYQLPRFLFFLHPKFRTPYVALGVFAVLASIIVVASRGKMMFLADLYNFGAMIAFFSAHLALIVLRIKKPDIHRPFKIPFNIRIKGYQIPITAILGCLATLGVWILIIVTKEEGRVFGLGWLAVGLILYFIYRKKKKIAPFTQIHIANVQIPDYSPLSCKHILVPTRGGSFTENVQIGCEFAKLYKADVTALHVMEIPASLPIDGFFMDKLVNAKNALRRAEAIAREFNIEIKLKLIRARHIDEAIFDLLKKEPYDLIVIGAQNDKGELGSTVAKILKDSPVRVWICKKPDLKKAFSASQMYGASSQASLEENKILE